MNILPTLESRWQLTNCAFDSLSFIFSDEGSARADLIDDDISAFANGTLSAVVLPAALILPTEIRCQIVIRVGEVYTRFDCFLLSNTNGFYSALLDLVTGAYDEAYVQIITTGACTVQQLSLDIITQSYDEVIAELRSELPKLLEDYNTYDMTLTTEEVTVGLITANLLENTDLQGHFSLSFLASNKAEIVMRIYDDQRKCLYSPSIVSVNAGKHTIGFPHAYLKSSIGYHNFYVTLQATEGNVKIPTRAIMYTIDSAHMAERLLNSFYMIDDITAKTQITSFEPTLLYTVGIVDNVATIRHIAPNAVGISNWTVDFIIESVKAAAIEYDGLWVASITGRHFVTEDVPVLFYTDMSDILWTQLFDSETRTQLATDVVKVSAVRGWRYISEITSNDTGLIVAYIKTDGKAYYRQYVSLPDVTAYWTAEELLPFTLAVEPLITISCGRVNDYRISFTVEDSESNGYALFTRRYYQADTVESTTIEVEEEVIQIGLAENIIVAPQEIWNTSNTETFVRFNYPLITFTDKQNAFKFIDANSVQKNVLATEKYDDYTIKLIHNSIAGFTPDLSIIFTNADTDGIYGPITVAHGTTTFAVQSFSMVFAAIDFSPKGFSTDLAWVSDAGISVTVTGISIKSAYANENVLTSAAATIIPTFIAYTTLSNADETAVISNVSIYAIPTKVGIDPL